MQPKPGSGRLTQTLLQDGEKGELNSAWEKKEVSQAREFSPFIFQLETEVPKREVTCPFLTL